MTIGVPTGQGPLSNVSVSPSGGGLKDLLINTGITIAETIITNYVEQQSRALQTKIHEISNQRKNGSKARGNAATQLRKRKRPFKVYSYRKYRRR